MNTEQDTPEPNIPVDPRLLEILVCPLTRGPLTYDRVRNELISRKAGLAYPIRNGIPIMLPDEARSLEIVSTPTDIKLRRAENLLEVTFTDGSIFRLTAEYLRTQSPSAEVQGHGPGEGQLVFGKKHVAITGIVPTGNYAVRLVFSDGHDTGIFTWDYLYALGEEFSVRWPEYLQKLEAAGRRRE